MKTENEESSNQEQKKSQSFENIKTSEAHECDKSSSDDQEQMVVDEVNSSSGKEEE